MPRSLSMFSQSGSISEFRWASCSSHRFCVSVSRAVAQIHAAAHIHTQPRMHNRHTVHLNIPAITHSHTKKSVCPWSFSTASVSGKSQPPTLTVSHLPVYTILPSANLPSLHPLFPISFTSLLSHLTSFCPFFMSGYKRTCSYLM